MWERYTSRPWHLYLFCLPLLLIGSASFAWGWETFGVTVFIVGCASGFWIVAVGIWQGHGEYIEQITRDAVRLDKVKNPTVWAALGYPQAKPYLPVKVVTPSAVPNTPPKLTFPAPPLPAPQVAMFANSVLRGGSMSETEWGGDGKPMSGPQIRKFKRWLEEQKFIALNKPGYPTQGFHLTTDGERFLLVYADPEIQALFANRVAVATPPPALQQGGEQ